MLLPLWDESKSCLWLRLGFLLAGGLSSPIVVAVLPLLYLRAYLFRARRAEIVVALAGTAVAAAQLHFVVANSAAKLSPARSIMENVPPKFWGWFVAGNFCENPVFLWSMGALLVGLVVAWFLSCRRELMTWILLALWGGVIALSVARMDPALIHPTVAGPRYFFFSYFVTFWILIQFFRAARGSWLRCVLGAVIGCAIANALPVWSRRHDDLHWADHVRSAPLFKAYEIPIEAGGSASDFWTIHESQATWGEFIAREWFHSKGEKEGPVFAYRALNSLDDARKRNSIVLVKGLKSGGQAQSIDLGDGRTMVASAIAGSKPREFLLRLRLGDSLYFHPDPGGEEQTMEVVGAEKGFIRRLPLTNHSVWLEFSNSRLPAEFTVRFVGNGPELANGSSDAIAIGRNEDGTMDIGVPR